MSFSPVEIPNPKPRTRTRKRTPLKTSINKQRLLEIFLSPPLDYDGSNAKLAQYMGLSKRQVIRLLNKMKAEGLIKTEGGRRSRPGGGYYTHRMIFVRKENE